MRSYLAAVVAVAVVALQAESLAFHVHAHDGQDPGGASHRHGPAIHDHGRGDVDEVRHVDGESSPATGSVITIAVPAATVTAAVALDVAMTDALRPPDLQLAGEARAIEVRSHSPPSVRHFLLRGPPFSRLL